MKILLLAIFLKLTQNQVSNFSVLAQFCLILLLFAKYFVTYYSIIGLVNTDVIITKATKIENKIPDASILVKKTDYDTKITKSENRKVSDFDTKPRHINNILTKQVQGEKKLCDHITFY